MAKKVQVFIKEFFFLLLDKLSLLSNYDLQIQIKHLLNQMNMLSSDQACLKSVYEAVAGKIFFLINNYVKNEAYENLLCIYIELQR